MPMSMVEMERALKQLRLSGIQASLEARALQATQGKISFIEAFGMLLQDEIDRRKSLMIERRFKKSGLEERKTFDDFDWKFNPKIPKNACFELLTLKFIQQGEDALLIGKPGTGKSHIAQAIAFVSLITGYQVTCRPAHDILEDLFVAGNNPSRKKIVFELSNVDLLIFDDLFLKKKLPLDASDNFQEIILNRYSKRKSTMITSNRVIEDWGKCLGDNAISSAILDRLLHRSHMLKFDGKSYRLHESITRLAKNKMA